MFRVLFLASILASAFGQLIETDTCNENIVGVSITPSELIGTWNQIARVNNDQEKGDCSSIVVSENNGTYTMSYREVVNKKEQLRTGEIFATVALLQAGIFVVNFPDKTAIQYSVLEQKNATFVLLYSCQSDVSTNTSKVYAWKYSATTTISAADETIISNTLASKNLNITQWRQVSQTADACDVSSGVSIAASPILAVLALLLISKDVF